MSLAGNKIRSGTFVPLSPPIKFIGSSLSEKSKAAGNAINDDDSYPKMRPKEKLKHLYVLPVLLLEFLALALTRAVIPNLLLDTFGDNIYVIMGCTECVRGLLAFVSCPMFGKISDFVGRRVCLFITVLGTCAPVCVLALMTWRDYEWRDRNDAKIVAEAAKYRIWVFVILLALSGVFSSTFTLTFAYISDTVKRKKDRVSAYGLALATFGLSFTIGPILGGYFAHVEDEEYMTMGDVVDSETGDSVNILGSNDESSYYIHPLGQKRVFMTSLVLTVIDLFYIYLFLPESITKTHSYVSPLSSPKRPNNPALEDEDDENISVGTNDTRASLSDKWNHIRQDVLPNAWNPFDTLKIFSGDPFMYEVGYIAFMYYTSLWAVVSTLMLYAVKRFKLGPERLGELMSALGLSTMISEAVLVRMVVPSIGEKKSMKVGLIAFFLQCIVLGIAYEGWQLFICVLLSMVGNLVYPSLTSLVSSAVAPEMVGEALGAVNGVKALTEGVGPLIFGALMTISEKSFLPGWPYLLASTFALVAYKRTTYLPDEEDEEYLSERYLYKQSNDGSRFRTKNAQTATTIRTFMSKFVPKRQVIKSSVLSEMEMEDLQRKGDEYVGLLSEVDEMDEDELVRNYNFSSADEVE